MVLIAPDRTLPLSCQVVTILEEERRLRDDDYGVYVFKQTAKQPTRLQPTEECMSCSQDLISSLSW